MRLVCFDEVWQSNEKSPDLFSKGAAAVPNAIHYHIGITLSCISTFSIERNGWCVNTFTGNGVWFYAARRIYRLYEIYNTRKRKKETDFLVLKKRL